MSQQQVGHLFRHEYGKLVALLLRKTGMEHLDAIEDSVQWAMAQALEFWPRADTPTSPSAWLYKVAYHHLLSELRTGQRKNAILTEHFAAADNHKVESEDITLANVAFDSEMQDAMLRMLFTACHDAIPVESQLVFTLKSLCGFNIREIALRLFTSQANVYKRFERAKNTLKNQTLTLDELTDNEISRRLPSIHRVLYLVFTEGYLSSHSDIAIRQDLCHEAIRLTRLLLDTKLTAVPNSYALLALMYFNLARIKSRQTECGALLLLEQQDRKQWQPEHITIAMALLAQSAQGDEISRYHIEANIAAEHCLSPSFEQTNWAKIIASYELLEQVAPSPLHQLNRAIATAQWQGPEAGLAVLKLADVPHWLNLSYHWHTVLAYLLLQSGADEQAKKHAQQAIAAAPTNSIKQLLTKRLVRPKL
ncbi:MAG: RNA polymerase sigma factor [Thalassotalea sp.]